MYGRPSVPPHTLACRCARDTVLRHKDYGPAAFSFYANLTLPPPIGGAHSSSSSSMRWHFIIQGATASAAAAAAGPSSEPSEEAGEGEGERFCGLLLARLKAYLEAVSCSYFAWFQQEGGADERGPLVLPLSRSCACSLSLGHDPHLIW